jgi:citrate synthase
MSAVLPLKGLEGIIATKSSICWIDGDAGVLAYRGIDIHQLAEQVELRGDDLSAVVRRCFSTASQLADSFRKGADRRAHARPELIASTTSCSAFPKSRNADGGACAPPVSLLSLYDPDEKRQRQHESQRAQELPDHLADRYARGHAYDRMRKGKDDHRSGPRRCRTRPTFCGC